MHFAFLDVIARAKAAAYNIDEKRYIFCYEVAMRPSSAGASVEFIYSTPVDT